MLPLTEMRPGDGEVRPLALARRAVAVAGGDGVATGEVLPAAVAAAELLSAPLVVAVADALADAPSIDADAARDALVAVDIDAPAATLAVAA